MRHIYRLYTNIDCKILLLGFILLFLFSGILAPVNLEAAINNTINFQSKIVDKTTGLNITVGTPACVKAGADTCDFQIRVWNDPSGTNTTSGSGNLMFTQTFQDVEIGDTNGTFNLVINSCGSTTSGNSQWGTSAGTCTVIDDSDSDTDAGVNFDRQDLYIEVGFAPTDTSGSLGSFTELFTRTGLKSVPSAFVAQTLSGIGASGFVQVAPSATQTVTSTNSLINLTSTATGATNPLLYLNENGSGTPDLLRLQVAGSTVLGVTNSGNTVIGGTTAGGKLDVIGGYFVLDNGDYGGSRGLRFRNSTDTTTPTGGGLYQANNDTVYLQAGASNFVRIRNNTASDVLVVDGANSKVDISTATSTAFLNIAASTTSRASLRLVSSAGTNPSSPNSGELWWNGTNLNFRTASTTVDLLAAGGGSYVNFISGSTQTTTSTNSLIDLTSTATAATNPLILVNENGSGTPDLLELQVAGNPLFTVDNLGATTADGGFRAPSGSVSAIPYSFSDDLSTGIYGDGAGKISFASLGTTIFSLNGTTSAGFNIGRIDFQPADVVTPSINFGDINTGIYKAGTNEIGFTNSSSESLRLTSAGNAQFANNILAGTATNTAFINVAASTTAKASLRLVSSAGTNPSSPNSGDLWWNGTNLNFRTASSTVDILAGGSGSCSTCVSFAPVSAQTTTSTNSLINIESTATGSTASLFVLNENGSGTPDLLTLQQTNASKFVVANTGQLLLTPDTNTNNVISILANFNTTGGANSAMAFTSQQLAATTGSVDTFTLTPTASISGGGNVAGMNGILVLPSTTTSGTTVSTARGFTSWPQVGAGTTITDYYAFNALNPVGAASSITNNYGIRVENQTTGLWDYGIYVGGADTYAIWSDSDTGLNRFDGKVEVHGIISGLVGGNNTRIGATGNTAGNNEDGSIYFVDGSGDTRARLDTAATHNNRLDGDGADGAITVSSSVSMNANVIASGRVTYADGIAYRINPPASGDTSVTRYRSADTISNGIAAGDEVMIINLQGATVVSASAPSYDTASVGNYEFKTVAAVSASAITFTEPVEHRYVGLNAINQKVIIQRVPNYTNVTINSGGTLTATAYDGLATVPTGGAGYRTGIVAFRATGTVTVNTGGTISVSALGYRGGTAGAAGANGGFNGESYNATGTNVSGRGGNGASNGETWGGGRSSNGAVAATNNGIARGGGGGGGSNGSASTGDDGSGGGGGGGYGGGGGGGGSGSNALASNGGTGGAGGSTDVAAGGGAGAQNTVAAGVNGGNAGSAGASATGTGGAAGNGMTSGAGGGGAAVTTAGGAGGGGGGLYGDNVLDNLFFGSGGGGGAGGFSANTAGTAGANGGGIIFIAADTISLPGTGTIQSNGGAGTTGTAPGSGGGGGAGGSIRLEAATSLSLGSSLVQASGGAVGSVNVRRGASGGGGVGRIYTEYAVSNSGTTTPAATVAQVTNNYGTLYVGNVNTAEADLAEYYITGDNTIEAGDVVSISPYRVANDNNEVLANQGVLRKTDKAYDSKLIGIISTSPGLTLGSRDSNGNSDNRALALKGRVPVKIDPDSEPISIGDYLTSSAKAGYAKKATEPGYTLGKALEYWNSGLNKETINVFVDLGYYYGGNSTNQEALALSNKAGLSISGYDIPSRVVNIISSASDSTGQVLGTNTELPTVDSSEETPTEQLETNTLERQIQLSLGSSELSDYYKTFDSSITTGDVVKFDESQNLIKTSERGDKEVMGVASLQPNILINGILQDELNRTISMGGKVVLKVTDINGPIKKGDYLAPSSIPGYAQKADNANGIVLGRAIEDFPLSLSPDSSMVKKELSKNKTETLNIIENLVRNGKFTANDANRYKDLLNQYFAESLVDNIDGSVAGRIVAYVNIGYITEGMMLPRNANVAQGTVPGSNTNQSSESDLSNIIEKLQNTQLTLNNVLTVKNVIEAQTYQNITGLDLAFKISSASNSFKVLDINNESLLQIDQNGKLTIKEGENSSIGEVLFPAQTNELFVDNKSVTEKSKIYLTPNEFVFSKVSAVNPGVGFTIQLQNVMDKEVEVSYLIIN